MKERTIAEIIADVRSPDAKWKVCPADIIRLADEVERLAAIVEAWPKTEDGEPIYPNREVWYINQDGGVDSFKTNASDIGMYKVGGFNGPLWYSTREAAEAGKRDG